MRPYPLELNEHVEDTSLGWCLEKLHQRCPRIDAVKNLAAAWQEVHAIGATGWQGILEGRDYIAMQRPRPPEALERDQVCSGLVLMLPQNCCSPRTEALQSLRN